MQSSLVLLNKKPGITSFQSLSSLKKMYGPTLGHAGTLDRFAQGLLLVMVGRFTKLNPLFTELDKTYEAEFTFGYETLTLDKEGERVFEGPLPEAQRVFSFQEHFLGLQEQVPPHFSSIHIQGKRAYQRALKGEELIMPPRLITVYQLEILAWQEPCLYLRIHCSKGTYIRSLARDWGRLAGSGATVTQLQRTAIGPFKLPQQEQEILSLNQCFTNLGIPMIQVQEKKRVLQGLPLDVLAQSDPHLRHSCQNQEVATMSLWDKEQFLALCQRTNESRWRYLFVHT